MDEKQARTLARGDLTQGSIAKKIILFCLPILGGQVFSQLYNVVDSIVVGNYVGAEALAAVGASFTMFMLTHSVMMGLGTGSSVVVAQYFGAKQQKDVAKAVNTTLIAAFIAGLAMTILGLIIARPVLQLLRTPANIIDNSAAYLRIVFIGLIGQCYYFMGSAILRGVGDSKWPMYFLIASTVINIGLDLLFVIQFNMGVEGVAWATILAQTICGIATLIRIFRMGLARFDRETFKLDMGMLKAIAKIGIPGAVQMMMSSLGMMIIQSFGNGFGSDFVATNTVCQRLDGFAQMPAMSMSTAITTFVGQNIGAGRDDRVKQGVRFTIITNIVVGVVIGVCMVAFGRNLIRIFIKAEEVNVIEMGLVGVSIMACGYWAMGIQQSLTGVLRGAGAAVVPMIIMVASTFLRIPIAYFCAVVPNDYRGMFIALVSTFIIGALLLLGYYATGRWKGKAIARRAAPAPAAAEESGKADE